MLLLATILFALAALGGLYLAANHFSGKVPPMAIALLHGALAATALVLVVAQFAMGSGSSYLTYSVVLFVIAALGGFFLFSFRLRKMKAPNMLIPVHAIAAIAGFVCLVLAQMN
jgi:hypothetical protein